MRILLITLIIVLSSCKNYDFKITELKQEKLKYVELPIPVKDFLIEPLVYDNENPSSLILINNEEKQRYKLEVVYNNWVSSWVDYMKLIDVRNKISYRINQGVPSPFFIYENKLYIPNRFNFSSSIDDLNKVIFTCYFLK